MVTCNEGYQNGGTTVTIIHCQSNLQWSYPGSCEKVCQGVPVVLNGIVSSGSNSPGARRQILCFPSYTLVGSSSTTCSSYGQCQLRADVTKFFANRFHMFQMELFHLVPI